MSTTPYDASKGPRAVTLNVLCPFLPPPSRFTFHNVPLVTTIAQLQARLAQVILGRVPAKSRLIFLGRPLTVDSATLEEVFGPVNAPSISNIPHPVAPSAQPALAQELRRLHGLHDPRAILERHQAILQGLGFGGGPSATQSTVQTDSNDHPIYQCVGPGGQNAIIIPASTRTTHQTVQFHYQSSSSVGPEINVAAGANPNPADRAMAENIVRQALVNNQQRRQIGNAANPPGIGRFMSRVWLFIRLYFFCYVISAPGTWTRIFFVIAALLISALSDTNVPQVLHGIIVQPLQRHLESLAHMGGPGQPATNPPQNHILGEISDYFRRAERSFVLFLASLVPGIGERQVEARNAAEAEARNAAEVEARNAAEAEAREQEPAPEQQQSSQERPETQVRVEDTQDNQNIQRPQQPLAPVPVPADW
ncbi:Ubiquitin supergroup [Penicillium sp. IBT 18751x]|nr:Ubiquitin supergroup [Penicillium sp. IBT 18751x]